MLMQQSCWPHSSAIPVLQRVQLHPAILPSNLWASDWVQGVSRRARHVVQTGTVALGPSCNTRGLWRGMEGWDGTGHSEVAGWGLLASWNGFVGWF